jgi:hypothetical protein
MKNKGLDEEESEREYERINILENLLTRTKESLANEIYNNIIDEGVNGDNREEGIPYMGWFWRYFDFIAKDVTIGEDGDNNIGVMANNKWDYPQRQMTEVEVDKFMEMIDRVIVANHGFSDDISFYKNRRRLELRKWVQELKIREVEK